MAKISISESRLKEIIKESIDNVMNEAGGPLDTFVNNVGVGMRSFKKNGNVGGAINAGKMSQSINNIDRALDQIENSLDNLVKQGIITGEEQKRLRGQLSQIMKFIWDRADSKNIDY